MAHEANVHRFRDRVALGMPGGPTNYLTPKQARDIAKLLNRYAKDVVSTRFVNSPLSGDSVPLNEDR